MVLCKIEKKQKVLDNQKRIVYNDKYHKRVENIKIPGKWMPGISQA